MDYEDEDPFDVVMFGYKRDQVDEYLRIQAEQEQVRLTQSLRYTDMERRLDEALAENAKLRSTVARMTEDLTMNRGSLAASARIQEMLRLAEEEAAAIRAEAGVYAEQVRRQAREDSNLAAAQRRQGEALKLSPHELPVEGEPKAMAKPVNGTKPRRRNSGEAQVQT